MDVIDLVDAASPTKDHAENFDKFDLFKVEDAEESIFWLVNVVDKASRFQVVSVLPNKSSAAVIQALEEVLLPWAGAPVQWIGDMGPEFVSEEFTAWTEAHGSALWHCAVEAPWQNGPAERAGQSFKWRFKKTVKKHDVIGLADVKAAAAAANYSGNEWVNETGYSPSQWVLGKRPRVGARDVTAEDLRPPAVEAGGASFARRLAMLKTCQLAQVRLSHSKSLRKAWLARARTAPASQELSAGDLCYFYREQKARPKGEKGKKLILRAWHGPAVVLGKEGQSKIYIGYRGNVTTATPEATRPASAFEHLSVDAWDEWQQRIDGGIDLSDEEEMPDISPKSDDEEEKQEERPAEETDPTAVQQPALHLLV